MPLRFVFALHNHQPVGNFGHVFESAYRDSYGPFLELVEQYPEVQLSLHTSGPLLEWLVQHRPEYIDRLRHLVERGHVEILGGGFYEPILPMIPARDRIGQVATYRTYLETLFGGRVRGAWLAERVWEQHLVADLTAAGVEYTVLDDFHFKQAGLEDGQLHGYYLTEYDGRLLRVFPISERMRYLIPFRDPEETIAYLGEVARHQPDAIVVFADDGEKLGSWPETHRHCYTNGWLRRFFDGLRAARSWIRFCTFSEALDETRPVGRVYLPDCSYREMTEWALPAGRLTEYRTLLSELSQDSRRGRIERFLRAGTWRNFQAKYPETREMMARMLQVSRRLQQAEEDKPGSVSAARQDLYKAQCNCPWWHGTFGGLYLPHLRQTVYQHLLAADNALLAAEHRPQGWVDTEIADLDLDGQPEVCLQNARLAAYLAPARGGSLYELDVRAARLNLLATLSRRPEAYHEDIRRHAEGRFQGEMRAKQGGLQNLLQYDAYSRKSMIDHFWGENASLEGVATGRAAEVGDFVSGVYECRVRREGEQAVVTLTRTGQAGQHPLRIIKEVRLHGDSDALEVRYRLEGCPRGRMLHFGVEWQFAGLAAGANDRYFVTEDGQRAGQLQEWLDVLDAGRLGLVDEWLGLEAGLEMSKRGGVWAFPIQTVSQSEGGFELVHQSTTVMPHWYVEPNADGSWEVAMTLRLMNRKMAMVDR